MSLHSLPAPVSSVEEVLRRGLSQAASQLGWSLEWSEVPLEHPAIESHGDWATPLALQIFGQRQNRPDSVLSQARSPREVAEKLLAELLQVATTFPELNEVLAQGSVAGPGFLNLQLKDSFWLSVPGVVQEQGSTFGQHTTWSGRTWEVEHTSPNPNKAMHLGHLRNNITAMAVARLWGAMGVNIILDTIDNNRGIAIAKLMWGYLKFARKSEDTPIELSVWSSNPEAWHTPESAHERPDRFMDALYVKAAQDCEANPEIEQLVRSWVVAWESGDELQWKLWRHVLEYVYQGQNVTLARLHNHYDMVWHEHEHYQAGKDLVATGVQTGVFRQLEDGAILTNLESYGLPDTIVQKNDGTALYITQDLALTKLKKAKFGADRMVWVIGPEQSLAMQQLFAVCEQLGIGARESFEHLSFGYMSIKGTGKMSSRRGNTIFIDDLLDMAKASIGERIKNDTLDAAQRDSVAELLAESAVKYAILKIGRTTDTQFDLENSISLEGDSGPYIQYAHARCQSILRQAAEDGIEAKSESLSGEALPSDHLAVLRWLNRYPEVVAAAAQQSAPNLVAQYLYELAQRFNAFYAHHSVLQAESLALKQQRLAVVAAVAQTLKNGFGLLGFEAVERM